jgi:type IV pilus assembly protein PilB
LTWGAPMFGKRTTTTEAPAAADRRNGSNGNGHANLPVPASATGLASADDLNLLLGGDGDSLYAPSKATARQSVEGLLLERGHVTEEQLAQARTVQAQTPGKALAQILLTMNAASEGQILEALAETLGLPYEVPEKDQVDPQTFGLLPPDYIRKHLVLPLRMDGRAVVVAMTDPNNVFLLDEVKRKLKRELKVVVTTSADVNRIVEVMTQQNVDIKVDEIIKDMAEDDVQLVQEKAHDDVTDLEKMGSESPVIRFVNYLIFDALKQGASDIHIEPKEKQLKIRYRIDGILFEAMNPPHAMAPAIVSRLKIMANLDISERRLPQDGRIRAVVNNRKIDLRMSTLPTVSGEKVVMRILDTKSINVSLDDLGFSENALTIWKNQIDQPHGIILVTGPTGSGKTTTLYSSLRQMDANKLNISTVEDPVEYHLASVNQTQMHERIGMTFAKALQALLRQDPDVVMLGEIRDNETATIAVQAALTGHLVLSTLHTNDAPSSITRLINIGVEPYLISSALNAVLAQRLVRKICKECRDEWEPSEEMKEFLALQGFAGQKMYKGKGCDRCRKTGYTGRLGIYEMLVMDDSLRDMVTRNPDVVQFRKLCRERGLVTLREDGFDKVMKGLTTVDEILRVTENAV